MDKEVIYIPYGQDEISKQDLMTLLANGLPNFVNQYKWMGKSKYRDRFMQIYDDMTKNLVGASNDGGKWVINSTNDISNYSPLDQELASHAAYYIQQQMSRITPRKKEEEVKKEEQAKKNKFNGEVFENDLAQYIGNKEYGGRKIETWLPDWLERDTAENNIYGTAKRQEALANFLQSYRDQFKKDDYNFEESPYGSYEEFNNRLEAAVKALKNPEWNQEDKDALNRLGLNREVWLATGANAPVEITDSEGNKKTITREQYNALAAEQEAAIAAAKIKEEQERQEAKQREEAAKKNEQQNIASMRNNIQRYNYLIRANPNNPYVISQFSRYQSLQDLQDYLENKYIKWDPSYLIRDKNELSGAYRLLFNNNKLTNISDKEYNSLIKFKNSKKYNLLKENLYKLDRLSNIIYDKSTNQIYVLTQGTRSKNSEDVLSKQYKKKISEYKRHMNDALTMAMSKGGTIDSLDKIIKDFLNSK